MSEEPKFWTPIGFDVVSDVRVNGKRFVDLERIVEALRQEAEKLEKRRKLIEADALRAFADRLEKGEI